MNNTFRKLALKKLTTRSISPKTGQVNESGTDCRTDAGVTVGLIDAIITLSRLLKKRDKSDKSVEEALKDLQDDEDFADLLQNLNIKTSSDLENVRKKIAETGPLTFLVQKSLELQPSGSSNFREEFLKMKPGVDRENFVLEEIKRRRPINQLVPVTVPGPKGTTITYYVMPDYITIDGRTEYGLYIDQSMNTSGYGVSFENPSSPSAALFTTAPCTET